jgi:Ran GTPase-activating protein (RanGAP) involved in mRNA processing and transport
MLKRKCFFLLMLFFLLVSWGEAQTNFSEPVDYEKLFAENLSRGGKVLNLSGKKIGDAGLKILLKQDFLKKLKKLDLRYNDISPNGAEILAQTPPLLKLKTLILKHNIFADEGTVALANSSSFPNLETLQLGWNEVRDAGALALAHSKNFPKLKKLDLRGNFLAGKTKDILRTSLAHLKSLRIFQSE